MTKHTLKRFAADYGDMLPDPAGEWVQYDDASAQLRDVDTLLDQAAHAISALIGAYTDARELVTGRRADTPVLAEAKATLDRVLARAALAKVEAA